jgi:hypothetical protein
VNGFRDRFCETPAQRESLNYFIRTELLNLNLTIEEELPLEQAAARSNSRFFFHVSRAIARKFKLPRALCDALFLD